MVPEKDNETEEDVFDDFESKIKWMMQCLWKMKMLI